MNSFWNRLQATLATLLSSGKVITALAGGLVYLAAKHHYVLSPEDAQAILIIVASLIGAQGLHDVGKGKAIIEAQSPKPPETVAIGSVENLKLPPSDPRPAPQGSGIQVKPKDSI